jgi:hypothetical protein
MAVSIPQTAPEPGNNAAIAVHFDARRTQFAASRGTNACIGATLAD